MELIQTIKNEIERLKGICTAQIKANPGQTFPFVMEMTGYDKLLSFLDTLQEPEQTCKTCGFYENNCPFIRGKLIPYPNKVCKDYTYSVVKAEQEPEVDLEKEIEDYVEQKWQFFEDLNAAVPIYLYDMTINELKDCARHFAKWGAEHLK